MTSSEEFLNMAREYFQKENWDEMEKNYMNAIKLDNVQAMVELADFYSEKVDNAIDQFHAQKYYKMAIEKGNVETRLF